MDLSLIDQHFASEWVQGKWQGDRATSRCSVLTWTSSDETVATVVYGGVSCTVTGHVYGSATALHAGCASRYILIRQGD